LAGHVASMGRLEMHTEFYSENVRGIYPLGNLGVDERIILK